MKPLFLLISLWYCSASYCQGSNAGISSNSGGIWPSQVTVSDISGLPFLNKHPNIDGHPFWDSVYRPSIMVLSTGKGFSNVDARIDLEEQIIYFKDASGAAMVTAPGFIKEFQYPVAGDSNKYVVFRSGYAASDYFPNTQFYMVMVDGFSPLLKAIHKEVEVAKDQMSGAVRSNYQETEALFLYQDGQMIRVKKDRDFFLTRFHEKHKEIEAYLKANRLNLKKEADLIKLIKYYNSL
ncbi:MAG: hypothetical protein LCH51_12480 [Bacteroidetes bacterium]|nr:hypothetical protein [Bacteroidota bacterium]